MLNLVVSRSIWRSGGRDSSWILIVNLGKVGRCNMHFKKESPLIACLAYRQLELS